MTMNQTSKNNVRSISRSTQLAARLEGVAMGNAKRKLAALVGEAQPGDVEIAIDFLDVPGDVGRAALHLLVGLAKAGAVEVVPAMRALAASSDERRVRRARKVLALLGERTSQLWLMNTGELEGARDRFPYRAEPSTQVVFEEYRKRFPGGWLPDTVSGADRVSGEEADTVAEPDRVSGGDRTPCPPN
jgi:hypothetical protein